MSFKMLEKVKGWPKWIKWLLGLLMPLLLIAGVVTANQEESGIILTAEKVQKRDIVQSVISNGRLESADKQEFFTPVDSTLMELSVDVGDKVKKGELLGRLDTLELGRQYQDAKAKLAQRQAELAEAMASDDGLSLAAAEALYAKEKNNYERMEYLYKEGAVTKQELEDAKSSYAQAEVNYNEAKIRAAQNAAAKKEASMQAQVDLAVQEVAQAKERLDLATFVAKDDGIVLFVGAEKGNRVLEGSRLLVVGSDKKLEVTANINEIDAGNLKVGQPAKITCMSLPQKEFNGRVTRVSEAAVSDEKSGSISVPVTITLEGDTGGLKPGYTVDINITTMEKKNCLVIPFESILEKDGEKIVYVVENGIAKERKVKTEPGNELYDIVVSGLKAGETVIKNPPPTLKDGEPVNIGDKND